MNWPILLLIEVEQERASNVCSACVCFYGLDLPCSQAPAVDYRDFFCVKNLFFASLHAVVLFCVCCQNPFIP